MVVQRAALARPGIPWPKGLKDDTLVFLQALACCGGDKPPPAAGPAAPDVAEQLTAAAAADGEEARRGPGSPRMWVITVWLAVPEAVAARDGQRLLPVRADALPILVAIQVLVAEWQRQGCPAAGTPFVLPRVDDDNTQQWQ